jgi:RND family efflux transporter MFP subunit
MPDGRHFLEYTPPKGLKWIVIGVACVALVVAVVGIIVRLMSHQSLANLTDNEAIPVVMVLRLAGADASPSLVLPGDIEAFYTAPVYARTTGYLKRWYTDIGAVVKKGQVLADIDAPDLDQQLQQAKGQLGEAIANENLAAVTAKRYLALKAENAVALEVVDQQVATWEADKAATAAALANVRQLEAEESFKQLVAPFDGVVTTRSTDIGALVTVGIPAGTSVVTPVGTSSSTPLFTVADESRLRIYVRVPQNVSSQVKPGLTANFTVPQYPGRTFTASLATTAQAVDATSGSLLAEFQTYNRDGSLKPGEYAQMRFLLPNKPGTVTLPSSALTFRNGGMQVATVNARSRVVMKQVIIGRDMGTTVEVANGLTREDRVVDNPPDSLRSGDVVRVARAGKRRGQS